MRKFPIERNLRWAERTEQMLKEGRNVFVIVGTAHLVGKESVVELLRKRKLSGQQIGETVK